MPESYTPQTWTNSSMSTPVSAARLTHIEDGIEGLDDRVTANESNLARITLLAGNMYPSSFGGPTSQHVTDNGLWNIWEYGYSTNGGALSNVMLPTSGFTTYQASLVWLRYGPTTGDVHWELTVQPFSSAGDAGTETVLAGNYTPGGWNVPITTTVGTFPVTSGYSLLHARLWRLPGDAGDTLNEAVGLVSIQFQGI